MRRAAALALLALAGWSPPAGAEEPAHPVVASLGPVTLGVADNARFDGLELQLRGPDSLSNTETAQIPVYAGEVAAIQGDDDALAERSWLGGAVPANVAAVEIEVERGRRLRVGTVASDAYRGKAAGRLRFFLLELGPGEPSIVIVRMFDAAGVLVGASTLDRAPPDVAGPSTVLRRRLPGGGLLRVRARVGMVLTPTPLVLDRQVPQICLDLLVRSSGQGGANDGCRTEAPSEPPIDLAALRGCGRFVTGFAGFVPDATRSLVVLLGSGRRVRFRARATPAAVPLEAQIVAGRIPRGEAVRSVQAVSASGRVLVRATAGWPPSGLPCSRDQRPGTIGAIESLGASAERPDGFADFPGTQVALDTSTPYSAGVKFVVRDLGDHLCVGLERLRVDLRNCRLPPVTPRFSQVAEVTNAGGHIVGLLAAPVAAVEAVFEDGGVQRFPTFEGPGYTGSYRGRLRFFAAPTGGRHVTAVRMLDSAGAVLPSVPSSPYNELPLESLLTRGPAVLTRDGRMQLLGTRLDEISDGGARQGFPCLALRIGSRAEQCEPGATTSTRLNVLSSCAPRATIVWGLLDRRARGVTVDLAGGRPVAARVVRFPASLQVPRARAFLAVLPRSAAITEIRVMARSATSRGTLFVPPAPAARQCGWRMQEFL